MQANPKNDRAKATLINACLLRVPTNPNAFGSQVETPDLRPENQSEKWNVVFGG